MTEPAVLATCSRTRDIVDAILDGAEVDQAHVTSCAACHRESERALRFTRGLAMTAAEVSEGIPDPAVVAGAGRIGTRAGHLSLRMATLAAAIAAGLLVAALIGTRTQPDPTPAIGAFASTATARAELALLDFACHDADAGVACTSTAPNHVHRVTLTAEGGRIHEVAVRIESTDDKAIDGSGGDEFFARIAGAVLSPDAATEASAWLRQSYASCGGSCSADLEGLSIALTVDRMTISLTIRER